MKNPTIAFCLVVCALFISCGKDDAPTTVNLNLDSELILSIVNENRQAGAVCGEETKASVAALQWSDELALAALRHSNDMQANDYFDHQSQDGRTFSDRAKDAGFTGSPVGENIAGGYPTEAAVMTGWMESPGHCRNIMTSNATHIGIAKSDEEALWTMVLGKE